MKNNKDYEYLYRKYPIEDIYFCKYQKYKSKYLLAKKKLQIQNGGGLKYDNSLWIEEDFFSKKEFEEIKEYCTKLELKKDPRSYNRLSLCLNPEQHKFLYDMIYKNKKFIQFIDSIKDEDVDIKIVPTYPIEYRKYFEGSEGMPWHQDTSLFTPDAFEAVLTITNTSDSNFLWEEENNVKKSISPKPNTLAIVKPSSVFHSVSKLNKGERTILKFVVEFIKKGEKTNMIKPTFENEIGMCPF
jgi:hypothetical protein